MSVEDAPHGSLLVASRTLWHSSVRYLDSSEARLPSPPSQCSSLQLEVPQLAWEQAIELFCCFTILNLSYAGFEVVE